MSTTNLKTFNFLENGEIMYSPLESLKTAKILDKGIYKLNWLPNEGRVSVYKQDEKEEIKIYNFEAKPQIDSTFKAFFSPRVRSIIQSKGFLHKIGLLLYGKEGTGKTTILKWYYNHAVEEHDAIVFYIDEVQYNSIDLCWGFVEKIRQIQDNPIVVVFEECDMLVKHGGSEGTLKMILDGNKSIDNCIFLATTNYIHDIPDALKNRKSRFKYCLEIKGLEDLKVIEDIMTHMLEDIMDIKDIKELIPDMRGKTLDDIKQVCIDKIMNIETYEDKKSLHQPIGFQPVKTEIAIPN